MRNIGKLLQRRLYTFVNTCWGFSFLLFLAYLILLPLVKFATFPSKDLNRLRGHNLHESTINFRDNIGHIHGEEYVAHEPIDIVYTWVNGSDPVWKAKKEFWAQRLAESHHHSPNEGYEESYNISTDNILHNATSTTNSSIIHLFSNITTVTNSSADPQFKLDDEDAETMTANRYRDSEELRFSLRSLVKNAPWIRHIYLVTDNQIPYWLNLETSKLTILSHEDIFANKSHLPVFSSPAIEANLHNIPGIAKKFIYFNDDVFLGSPTLPDDFVTLTGAQKFVMAWDVPKCAPGCSDSWIGDGYCDRACNVSACNWDFPDCINGSNANPSGFNSYEGTTQTVNVYCTKYCPDTWLADKICDQRCKIPECGWDIGDCGLDLVLDGFHGVTLDGTVAHIPNAIETADQNFNQTIPHATPGEEGDGTVQYYPSGQHLHQYGATDDGARDRNPYYYSNIGNLDSQSQSPLPALSVPYGTFAVYFNLSLLPCYALSVNQSESVSCSLKNLSSSFLYTTSSHDDYSKFVVHQSILLNKHNLLVVTLFHGQDEAPRPHFYPYVVTFSVHGHFPNSDPVQMIFSLQIIDPESIQKLSNYVPHGMKLVDTVVGDRIHGFGFLKAKVSSPSSMFNTSSTSQPIAAETSHDIRISDRVELLKLPFRRSNRHNIPLCEISSSVLLGNTTDAASSIDSEERFVYLVQTQHIYTLLQQALLSLKNSPSVTFKDILSQLVVTSTWSFKETSVEYYLEEPLFESLVEYTLDKTNFQSKPRSFLEQNHSISESTVDSLWVILRQNYRSFLESSLSRLIYDSPIERRLVRDRLLAVQHLPKDGVESINKEENKEGGGILISVPLPILWKDLPLSWMHVKVEIGLSPKAVSTHTECWQKHKLFAFEELFSNTSSASNANIDSRIDVSNTGVKSSFDKYLVWTNLIEYGRNMSEPFQIETNAMSEALSDAAVTATIGEKANEVESINIVNTTIASNQTTSSEDTVEHHRQLKAQFSPWNDILHPMWVFYTSPLIELADYFSSGTQFAASINPPEEFISHSRHRRRRLLDTYAQSLIHVNRLYNKEFGTDNRKVPAHVPHMIDRDFMGEMQQKWSAEWNATSSHRFRAVDDMQFAFAYYYYVMNRRKIQPPDFLPYLEQAIDTNRDHFIDPNEWHTLLSVLMGSRFTEDDDKKLSHCVRFPHFYDNSATAASSNESLANATSTSSTYLEANISFLHPHTMIATTASSTSTVEHRHRHGKLIKSVSYIAYPRVSEVLECKLIVDALKTKVDWHIRQPTHFTESDKDLVAFEMIGDNMTESLNQLNSIRQRQSKFICVNDNMQNPSPELTEALQAFFQAMFPTPSIFELPANQRNPTLYIDEYRHLQELRRQQRQSVSFQLSQFFSTQWITDIIHHLHRELQSKIISWAQYILENTPPTTADAPEALSPDVIELQRLQHKLQQDAQRDPLAHHTVAKHQSKSSAASQNKSMWHAHVAAWMMVVGLVLILALRMATSAAASTKNDSSGKRALANYWGKKDDEDRETPVYSSEEFSSVIGSAFSSSPPTLRKRDILQDETDEMNVDDEETHLLQRLQRIERSMYQQEDDDEYDEEDQLLFRQMREKEAFSRLPLTTPIGASSAVNTHDQLVGYRPDPIVGSRPNILAPSVVPQSIAAPAYPKRFQTVALPATNTAATGAVQEEVEEVIVVDDRVYTASDTSYLRKYSAAMLEDAAGTGPGTTAMQWEIFTDGVLRSRSRANSETFTASTFPSHK